MFFVTNFEKPQKRIFSLLKLALFGENPWVEYQNINGIVYGVIKGVPKGNRRFFHKVKNIVWNDPLIFQSNFDIFERNKRNKPVYLSPPFTPPDTTEYFQRLLVNFALEVSKSAIINNRIKVLLVDIGGNCAGVCIEFLKVAQEVTVLTNNPNRYDACIRYANQTFGTTPKLISKNDKINNISLIVAPYGLCGYTPQNAKTPVFSIKDSDNGYSVFNDGIVIENWVKSTCPKYISPILFSSQIFIEKGHITKDKAVFMCNGNKLFTVEDMVNILT